jgi:D-aminopeptidase
MRDRALALGLRLGQLEPGPNDAISDVPGVRVAHSTLIAGGGPLIVGSGPVRTGVTVIVPPDSESGREALFAGSAVLNGNGELTGLAWVRESGLLTTPIALTNTHSLGLVRDALIAWEVRQGPRSEITWSLPVVGETWDGLLNDIDGFHVRPEHVWSALDAAAATPSHAPVDTGNVGGGTGMICHGFKGGIGTASRRVPQASGGWMVGVLVQANHGRRARLRVEGRPVGEAVGPSEVPLPAHPGRTSTGRSSSPPVQGSPMPPEGAGSIIVVVATDAPLLPRQLDRLAGRAALGIGRTGGLGEQSSGDLMVAFSVAQRLPTDEAVEAGQLTGQVTYLHGRHMDPLFAAVVEGTEAAIVDALLSAETMVGRDGITAHALPAARLEELLTR